MVYNLESGFPALYQAESQDLQLTQTIITGVQWWVQNKDWQVVFAKKKGY